MSNDINIVYTGSFQFPEGMAGTKRVKNLILTDNCISNVFLISNSSNNDKFGVDNGIPFYTMFKNKNKYLNLVLAIPYILLGIIKLNKLFNKEIKRNMLYVYSGINIENIFLVLLAKLIGYIIIVDIVEDFSLNEEKVSKWRAIKIKSNIYFEKKLTSIADGIVVISGYLKHKFSHKRYRSIPIIHLPISASNIKLKLEGNPDIYFSEYFHILYSGTYGKKDGFYYILDAIEKLVHENKKIKLVLTGTIPKKVNDEIQSRKLDNYILQTGFMQEGEYYNMLRYSDVLLMTRINSKYANAGFPFKLGEYLASGSPVIVTRVSDVDFYLKDNDNAFVIEPDSSDEILDALKTIFIDKENAKVIGRRGQVVAEKYFNPIIHKKQLLDFVLLNF